METLITIVIFTAVAAFFLHGHRKHLKKREAMAQQSLERGAMFSEGPRGLHPHINTASCIGCATCTTVCPEGDVLAMLGGKATIANGQRCIGHGICAEACPVGAISMVRGSPEAAEDMPYLTAEYETSIPNLFIAGELGGLALIKNAINQGRDCVDTIANRLELFGRAKSSPQIYEAIIVGAGPAGISASLRAVERNLRVLTLEQDEVGGTVAKYPRQKIVLTSPVELPLYGRFKKTEIPKEHLLALWDVILNRADLNIWTGAKVEDVRKEADGTFTVVTPTVQYRAYSVVLALGRSGTPRKLGVKGEELPKVMYRLIEADHYRHKKILVVGGGDSAVEAAMGLAAQPGNEVTISYRRNTFNRIKARNSQRIEEYIQAQKLRVIFNSVPVEFRRESVVLDVEGNLQAMANDFTWILAGGAPPKAFLQKIGVAFATRDMSEIGTQIAQRTSG